MKKTKRTKQNKSRRQLKYTLVFLGMAFALILTAILLTQCAVKGKVSGETGGTSQAGQVFPESPGTVFSTENLEIPQITNPEFLVVCREGRYTLWYDTLYRQAAWVAHRLTGSDLEEREAKRKNRFVICQAVREKGWPYAVDKDYTNSGYDRGHLVPSADRVLSQEENDATFRLSNIAPQTPRLNRVLWSNLEAEVRRMTQRLDTLWIVTGGELKPGLERIGTNGIGIPEYFFKVLLAKEKGKYMAIGFLIPNAAEIKGSFWDYAVSVDEVEKLSGIDFFPNLPDSLEARIESECRPEQWK